MKTLVLLISLFAIAACNATEDSTMPSSIQEIKSKHEAELMKMPGVVSVGIGLEKAEKVIIIGVENEKVANSIALPRELDGYSVEVKITGKIRAQ